jgi:hypothetical protein
MDDISRYRSLTKPKTDKRNSSIYALKEGIDFCLEVYLPANCSIYNLPPYQFSLSCNPPNGSLPLQTVNFRNICSALSCCLSFCQYCTLTRVSHSPRLPPQHGIQVSARVYLSQFTRLRVFHVVITDCRKLKLKAPGCPLTTSLFRSQI